MRKVVLSLVLVTLFSGYTVMAQEKSNEKKVDVKVEKKIIEKDGEQNKTTKVIVMKDGKVVLDEEGTDLTVREALRKAGISKDEIDNIEVKVDSDIMASRAGKRKMMWMNSDQEDYTFQFDMDDDFMMLHEGKRRPGRIPHNIHTRPFRPMMFPEGKISVYDFSKSDEDTKEFNNIQEKEIEFTILKIQAIRRGLFLEFETKKDALELSIKNAEGKKIFYEKNSGFDGKFSNQIPLINADAGVYVLEVKIGKRNWLQKLVVE
ncbi:MAG: T9SS type A sorting domain-containing protein [Bacteroidota bacterium]